MSEDYCVKYVRVYRSAKNYKRYEIRNVQGFDKITT